MKHTLNVTVCELRSNTGDFANDWAALANHVQTKQSDLVLLPEMGLAPWFARTRPFDAAAWQQAVATHAAWMPRLTELSPAAVIGTRPIEREGKRQNQGFVWDQAHGEVPAHLKYYLPDEEDFWEASWYERGDGSFDVHSAGAARLGFLICTEMWFFERGRAYGQAGAHLIATPRCTPHETRDKWLAGGRTCAVVSGAYSLSSNHADKRFGGLGWVIDPEGVVLATTSPDQPFVTVPIDLRVAEAAKQTYPRYVRE